ncbi:MAG: orotidine-5'-phosphate decarboxylase [Candidatus Thermoplasmatota archaeon]
MDFKTKLTNISRKNDSILCVGLDVDRDKIPSFLFNQYKNPFFEFNKSIIDSTKDLVCAYKLNIAFYETLGSKGFDLLKKTVDFIPEEIIIILDGKRNDIGNTARKYAESLYETYHGDAATVNPYLGIDGVKPFLGYKDKCSFILCRTSNPSATDFQDLIVENQPMFQKVAEKINEWNEINDNCGAVVGATYPQELKKIRKILGEEIPLLLPGIGKQGGDVEKTVKYGTNKKGEMAIINSSRGIIYAGKNQDFAEKSRQKTLGLKNQINKYR